MLKLTRRSYKRKIIAAGAGLFMSVALISTGFASFVISGQKQSEGNGGVTIGTINDAGLDITLNNNTDLGTFLFEAKEGDTSGRIYADTSEGAKYENLTITVSGKVNNHSHLGSLTISMEQVDGEGIKAAATSNYIVLPACMNSAQAVTVDQNDGTFSYDITFTWGSVFSGQNPCIYYDDDEKGQQVSDEEMISTMNAFRNTIYGVEDAKEAINDLKYKVTLTAVSK